MPVYFSNTLNMNSMLALIFLSFMGSFITALQCRAGLNVKTRLNDIKLDGK